MSTLTGCRPWEACDRLGIGTLRPGGAAMTEVLLDGLNARAEDRIVQFWPEPGVTADQLLEVRPCAYRGVTADAAAAERLDGRLRDHPGLVELLTRARADGEYVSFSPGSPDAIDLPDEAATAIVGECVLSPLSAEAKQAVVGEIARLLPPGGRVALHEFCLTPQRGWNATEDAQRADDMGETLHERCGGLTPLTPDGWRETMREGGLIATGVRTGQAEPPSLGTILRDHGARALLRLAPRLLSSWQAIGALRALAELSAGDPESLGAAVIVAERPLIDDILVPDTPTG